MKKKRIRKDGYTEDTKDVHSRTTNKGWVLCCDMSGLDKGDQTVILNYINNQSENITHLKLYGSDEITDLSVLANCPKLQSLHVQGCPELNDLSGLANCTNLQNLHVQACPKVKDLSGLANCPKLQTLNLSGNPEVNDLSILENCPNLQSLNVHGCPKLKDLSGLVNCPNLQTLNLSGSPEVNDLSVLVNCPNLQTLSVQGCPKLKELSVLENCRNLQSLHVQGCPEVNDLSVLANCTNLKTLSVQGCPEVNDLSVLANCPKLQSLHVQGCPEVNDLSVLANCTNLKTLSVQGCPEVNDLSVLANCPKLQNLHVQACPKVNDLSVLANCPNLQNLHLQGCPKLNDLSVLENCSSLQTLSVYECLKLDVKTLDVQIYQNLKSLKVVSHKYIAMPNEWVNGLFQHPTLEDITLRNKDYTRWIMSQQVVNEAIRLKKKEKTVSTLTPLQEKIQGNLNSMIVGDDNFYYCLYVYAGIYKHQNNDAKFKEMVRLYEQAKRPDIKKLAAAEVLYLWSLTKLNELMTPAEDTQSERPEILERTQMDLSLLIKGVSLLNKVKKLDELALSATTKQQLLTVLQYLKMNLSDIDSDSVKFKNHQKKNINALSKDLEDQKVQASAKKPIKTG